MFDPKTHQERAKSGPRAAKSGPRATKSGHEGSWKHLGAILRHFGAILGSNMCVFPYVFQHFEMHTVLRGIHVANFNALRAILEPLGMHLWGSGGGVWGVLGRPLGDPGPSWALPGRSFAHLRSCGSPSGLSWPLLGRSWLVLGRSWPLLGRFWPLLGPSWPLLGRS
jgi:hypothetical protein